MTPDEIEAYKTMPLHTVFAHTSTPEDDERGQAGKHELERRRLQPLVDTAKDSLYILSGGTIFI